MASCVTVVDAENPNALSFYERVGVETNGDVSTRFGRGVTMTLNLSQYLAR